MHQRVLFWEGGEATARVSYLKSLFNLCESLNVFFVFEIFRSTSSHDPVREVESREEKNFLFCPLKARPTIDTGLK